MHNPKPGVWAVVAALPFFVGCGAGPSHTTAGTTGHRPHPGHHAAGSARHTQTAQPSLMPTGLLNAGGSAVPLTVGENGTAVLFVNPASPLSAYEARWVIPPLLLQGMDYAVVMALPAKTVATPGSQKPINGGKAGQSAAADTPQALGSLASALVNTWRLPKGTQIYTVTPATVRTWHLTGFPTLWVVNPQNQVVAQLPGALSPSTAQSILNTIKGGI